MSKNDDDSTALMLLNRAIEQVDESIIITDQDGAIIYVNPAFSRATGYSAYEVIGRNPRILKSGKQQRNFYQKLWDTIKSGNTWRGIFVNRHKDGHIFYEESTISAVKCNAGKITHFVAVKRDITESMRLQERLAQSEKLSAAGQIAAGVAHEVNNPLTVILGLSQIMAQDDSLSPVLKDQLGLIVKHAKRAGRITQNMLSFSRKNGSEKRNCDLRFLLGDTLPLVRHDILRAKVKLFLKCTAHSVWVKIDCEKLREILINLVMNALHAMEDRETRHLIIGIRRELDKAVLYVQDTGTGIAKEALPRIFEPFYTTKPIGKGTGLGLSICYGIAVEHGGLLAVDSSPKGTTFSLELPLCPRESSS